MKTWFVRANGSTRHNQPGTKLYVPGEPPNFPTTKKIYIEQFLQEGFARIGWPASGDLRLPGWQAKAIAAYGEKVKLLHLGYLLGFLSINVGDLILIPTYRSIFKVHIGMVISPRKIENISNFSPYYYYFKIETQDWLEMAHRVDVESLRKSNDEFNEFYISRIGGIWRRAFGEIKSARNEIISIYSKGAFPTHLS